MQVLQRHLSRASLQPSQGSFSHPVLQPLDFLIFLPPQILLRRVFIVQRSKLKIVHDG